MARRRGWGPARSTVVFSVGIAGIVYETVREKADRPWLLAVFAAMCGLPAAAVGDDLINMWLAVRSDKGKNGDETGA